MARPKHHLVVIGGASLDRLHFGGDSRRSAGGAGLYTALAARAVGLGVTMIGPRPEPMVAELAEAAGRLDWRGPGVPAARLPSFEIAHHGGGASDMVSARLGAEAALDLGDLPTDLPPASVYCIPLLDPARQLRFLQWARGNGRQVSCGTCLEAIRRDREGVRRVLRASDRFFCNEEEAAALFGSPEEAEVAPGRLLFVTRGPRGARVVQGRDGTEVPAVRVEELDATGAGDTFCGTVLARLELGDHPLEAARHGAAAAARMVTGVGPEKLLLAYEEPAEDRRLTLDEERIGAVAGLLGELRQARPFDFTGDAFPPVGDPVTIDFFFTATLQQFGFWSAAEGRYAEPMTARLEGLVQKGSDYLWRVYRRWAAEDPAGLTPARQAALEAAELESRFLDDDGRQPLPQADERLRLARAYGGDLAVLGPRPVDLVARANQQASPQAALLGRLDGVAGYKEDPLRKKSALLAAILRQRPEGFLRVVPGEELPPIVDYHVQRSCLRLGLVRVVDRTLRRRLEERLLLSNADEEAVRRASYRAMERLRRVSGRSMGTIDWFFFQNRRRCPEMERPVCSRCEADAVCAHRTELFQPVRRTTFY